VSCTPVVVNSRAELEKLLRENPMQLRAGREPLPPRVGHPGFVGPYQTEAITRPGAIRYDEDGGAFIELEKKEAVQRFGSTRPTLYPRWEIERFFRETSEVVRL